MLQSFLEVRESFPRSGCLSPAEAFLNVRGNCISNSGGIPLLRACCHSPSLRELDLGLLPRPSSIRCGKQGGLNALLLGLGLVTRFRSKLGVR